MSGGSDAEGAAPTAGFDPEGRAQLLARVRDDILSGRTSPVAPRSVVSESWRRSLHARVDPDHGRPHRVFDDAEVADLRGDHPLAPVLPLLRSTLLGVADEAMHVMIVTDAEGHILWREGARPVLHRADAVALVEGTRWSEDAMGTNAMGTALAAGRSVNIHSAEHLVDAYRTWTCAAAPIHDPDTGETLGVVDLTGGVRSFHASTLALVDAAARLAEHHLVTTRAVADERLRARNLPHLAGLGNAPGALLNARGRVLAATPHGWIDDHVALPESGGTVSLGRRGEGILEPLAEGWLLRVDSAAAPARPTLALPFLGAVRASARLDGRTVRLGLRHAELLTLLALHPDGLSADGLAVALYGERGNPVTVRAEMHRLRGLLEAVPGGDGVLRTAPYRLAAHVDADFLDLRDALRSGRVPPAPLLARGPLLPLSDAPGVCEQRDELDAGTRRTVLRRGDTPALWALAQAPGGRDDTELVDRLLRLLPASDPRRTRLRPDGAPRGSQ